MLESLIETIAGAYDGRRHRELLTALWEQERWFDTPHQRRAAEIARDALAEAKLDSARIAPFAADGKTRFQDWITHLAWECPSARLAIADDGEVLADRESCPQSVVYWGGPLASPSSPAVGGVVDADKLEQITPEAVDGKFVLTGMPPAETKRRLLGTKPLAVVSDYLGKGNGYTEETTKWCNTWSDHPGGWYVHAGDSVLAGFCLSPAAGKLLRQRLAGTPDLQLTGYCDSRLYEGTSQNVTAVLGGDDPAREIWIFGHACEQGAHDNCAGVSVLIEALRMLKAQVAAGRLSRPRYGIRMITTEECLGMTAFATLHDDLLRRALVGLNVDGAGGASLEDRPFILTFGPWASPSFGWAVAALAGRILQARSGGNYHFRARHGVPTADDMIADPNCGVPAMWLGQGGESTGYHSSADTPDVCPDESLRSNALLTAAWAYAMASMNDRLAEGLIPPAAEWIEGEILRAGDDDAAHLRRWAAAGVLRDLARWDVSESLYEPAASKYASAEAEPLPDLPTAGPRYIRSTWGTCTLETLPPQRAKGFSRWSGWQTAAVYWNDGRRPLSAVERLAKAEAGGVPEGALAKFFAACVEAGLMVQDNSEAYPR